MNRRHQYLDMLYETKIIALLSLEKCRRDQC